MNRRTLVLSTSAIAGVAFVAGSFGYLEVTRQAARARAAQQAEALVRPHSAVFGPADAPVTIVEFFDPSCEACRAFYPIVKQIMAAYPDDVRLVLRYAAFHERSDEVVRILEAARRQDQFVPVLEALLARQPEWALHDNPNLDLAWDIAIEAGLDETQARADAALPEVDQVLRQDMADVEAVRISGTPTFFVDAMPLDELGPQQLYDLVTQRVAANAGG